ncbi:hypothetical protein CANCADRAFT_17407, partial [Tortispora caseinolytica NRRL Y-17796]
KCIVEFVPQSSIDLSTFKLLSDQKLYGIVGLIHVQSETYLCTISSRTPVAAPRFGETVNQINDVYFYCLTSSKYDFIQIDTLGNASYHPETSGGTRYQVGDVIDHPCLGLRRLLADGSFYYSPDFDVTSNVQRRQTGVGDCAEDTFMWNSALIQELLTFRRHLLSDQRKDFDKCKLLTTVIRGFAASTKSTAGGLPVRLTVISKLSSMRAGTRFNARGVDDSGAVANFVETETVVESESFLFAYTQVRGSVPVFWEQSTQLLTTKIKINRSKEATQPAFNKHFDLLTGKYGLVYILNLLSATKPGELELSQRYRQLVEEASLKSFSGQMSMLNFDFHAEVSRGGSYSAASNIIIPIQDALYDFGFFLYDRNTSTIQLEQTGVFRTNCLDCLDRTNLIQEVISRYTMELFFRERGVDCSPGVNDDIFYKHSIIWADSGDQLSKIYAGTGALKSSYTRSGKMNLAGALSDATKSVSRLYINNFMDKSRQQTIDFLLGRLEGQVVVGVYDPINDYVESELERHKSEFSAQKEISIVTATFNAGGAVPDGKVNLDDWLFPASMEELPDIFVIGIQELVDLTPGQIINADSGRRVIWEETILNSLNSHGNYALLRVGQLVGTALFIFGSLGALEHIHSVEGSMKKTGFGGMAGNKGGLACSLHYADTSFCFITAHFAAGQQNVEERVQNYKTLSNGLRFSRGRSVQSHDAAVWFGDFNFRIGGGLSYEDVMDALQHSNLEVLLESDQLHQCMVAGLAFPYYREAVVTFMPTYKFDVGTDSYDTSEKQRIPSWTDRIIYKGKPLRSQFYNSVANIRLSDHKPVTAIFRASVEIINREKRTQMAREIYERRRNEIGGVSSVTKKQEVSEITLKNGLPPPSSNNQRWWLNGGKHAKVQLPNAKKGTIVNPALPNNPF